MQRSTAQTTMSRFNKSQKSVPGATSDLTDTDIRDNLAIIGQDTLENPDDSRQITQMADLIGSLDRTAGVIAGVGLENCRKIKLPRNQNKTLLVPEYDASLQQSVEAYRTLRTRLVKLQDQTGMRSLVVSSAGPAEGKTLTSFNLALCLTKIQDWPVLLVDADLRTWGLSRLLGDPPSNGLAQILDTGCAYESAILQTDVSNLYVLPAGESALPAPELFSRPAFKEFIRWSSKAFKLVILDAPPVLHLADFELIEAVCDGVMLVVRLGKTNQDSLAKTYAHVDSQKLAGLVLNGSHENAGNAYYRYLKTAGAK